MFWYNIHIKKLNISLEIKNGWVFVYELSDSRFESSCSHFNFRFRTWFKQGVPWHSGNYRVWIHSETRTWHDKNIVTQKHCLKMIYSLVCRNDGRKELWKGHLRRLLIRKPWTVKLKEIMKLLQVLATLQIQSVSSINLNTVATTETCGMNLEPCDI